MSTPTATSTLTTVCWVLEGRHDELRGLLDLYLDALHRLDLAQAAGVWQDRQRTALAFRVAWATPEGPAEACQVPLLARIRARMDSLCREQRVSLGSALPTHLDLQSG